MEKIRVQTEHDLKRGLGNSQQFSANTSRVEDLERRVLMSADTRTISEVGNNVANPTWGTANVDLIRIAAAAYGDGLNSPALAGNKSAREISNLLNDQATSPNSGVDIATIDQNSVSDYGYAFGQFMDHDLDLTPDGGDPMPISVPAGDPIGPQDLPFTRSQFDPATGITAPRQQTTVVTSYLDLSNVYGSTDLIASALRTGTGGLLKTSPGNMLPYNNSLYFTTDQITALNMANDAGMVTSDKLFAAGDRRANENLELTAIQTLFMRNHNRIAGQLENLHPTWTDEMLYQEARKINIAQYQSIVYNEWIPAVLGANALHGYKGYNASVNPTISNEFSTVAFRFGHSMVSADIGRHTNAGISINDPAGDDIPLSQDFFDPNLLNPSGVVDTVTGHLSTDIGVVLKADADGNGQAMDLKAVSDVRNLLFGNGAGGDDLMARDVQRARDNGIGSYNALRVAFGLPAVSSFSQITRNVQVQQQLAAAYGNVSNIDAFEGGLAEDHVRGSDVGPLFQAIMVDQFTRLRDGDRFFYLNENFTPEEWSLFSQGNTLAKVITANTEITNLQSNVFKFRTSISRTVSLPGAAGLRTAWRPLGGVPGITVQLQNDDGEVVATTLTNWAGGYQFTQLSTGAGDPSITPGASGTGTYHVLLVLPSSLQQTGTTPSPQVIGVGDTVLNGVNFTVASTLTPPPTYPGGPGHGHFHFGDRPGPVPVWFAPVVATGLSSNADLQLGDASLSLLPTS